MIIPDTKLTGDTKEELSFIGASIIYAIEQSKTQDIKLYEMLASNTK